MTAHDSLTAAVTAANNEYGQALDDLDAEQAQHAADNQANSARITALTAQVAQLTADLAACEGTPPEPPVPPTPVDLPPLLGHNRSNWATKVPALQSTGGRFECMRVFYGSLTQDPTNALKDCVTKNVVAHMSFKPGSYTWAQIASGSADAALKTLATRIKAVMGNQKCYITVSHEPDSQDDPKTMGEGGPASDFGKMWTRVVDVMRPIYPAGKYGPIFNGWWFGNSAQKYTDAEIEVWLPKAARDKMDFVGSDDYGIGSQAAVLPTKNRVAYLKRVGFQGFTTTGETNVDSSAKGQELKDIFAYAKTEPMFSGGNICLWNDAISMIVPVDQIGLQDEMQAIVKGWRV